MDNDRVNEEGREMDKELDREILDFITATLSQTNGCECYHCESGRSICQRLKARISKPKEKSPKTMFFKVGPGNIRKIDR
jgi:hypothetical protein